MKKSVLVAMMMVLAAVVGILAVCEAASASMGMGLLTAMVTVLVFCLLSGEECKLVHSHG